MKMVHSVILNWFQMKLFFIILQYTSYSSVKADEVMVLVAVEVYEFVDERSNNPQSVWNRQDMWENIL